MVAERDLRLLLFNLKTDADAPILGFTTRWVNRLAPYCAFIDVITMQAGRLDVAENVRVYSVGREKGYSEPRRVLEFYRLLLPLLLSRRYDACFAHMMPLFAGMAGPLLTLWGIPTTLWYTHRQVSNQLRLGLWMSHRVVSAVPDSFPIETDKLRAIGHGIDTAFYAPGGESSGSPVIVQVARLMPIKHQMTLFRAAQGFDVEVVLVGGVPDAQSTAYRDELVRLADELAIRVTFAGDQPPEGVRDWYRRATVAVNLSPVGLFDKAALEAMACGVPTIVSNSAFDPVLGEHVEALRIARPDDVDGLAARLRALLALPESDRGHMGTALRARTIEAHSLDRMMGRLLQVLQTGEPE